LGQPVLLCFQSQGGGNGDWIGPDLRAGLERVQDQGHQAAVIAPIGFLAEQLETLYDLDIEAAEWAAQLGLRYQRLPVLGDHPSLIQLLAAMVRRALAA
jgi:ferrochelatase